MNSTPTRSGRFVEHPTTGELIPRAEWAALQAAPPPVPAQEPAPEPVPEPAQESAQRPAKKAKE